MSDGRVKVTGKPSKYFSLTDDNISQITMTPSLVKASSTMPKTDEVQVRRHQGSCQSKCCANIVNYISVFSTYSKNSRYSKYCYGEDTTDESRI